LRAGEGAGASGAANTSGISPEALITSNTTLYVDLGGSHAQPGHATAPVRTVFLPLSISDDKSLTLSLKKAQVGLTRD
jgi:hypothetical protein